MTSKLKIWLWIGLVLLILVAAAVMPEVRQRLIESFLPVLFLMLLFTSPWWLAWLVRFLFGGKRPR